MKRLVVAALMALAVPGVAAAQGQHWVNGYYRSNGTYVQGHMQTNPDGNPYNNWTTQGNVNPYTGQPGTRQPYPVQPSYTPPPVAVPDFSQPPPTVYGGGGINPNANNGLAPRGCRTYGCF